MSINFDENISGNLGLSGRAQRYIGGHISSIGKLAGTHCAKRTKKSQIAKAFRDNRDSLERIIYFYCHGRGSTDANRPNLEETQLVLTDEAVSAYDFQLWSKDKKLLPPSPLIFVNACQGGQMTTLFYKTFAAELEPSQAAAFPGISADAIEIAREHGASAFALNGSHRPGRSEISGLSSIRAVTTLADVRAETATLLPRLSNMSGQ